MAVVVFHPVVFDHTEELEGGLGEVDVDDIVRVEEDAVTCWFRITSQKRKEVPAEVTLEGFNERFPPCKEINLISTWKDSCKTC